MFHMQTKLCLNYCGQFTNTQDLLFISQRLKRGVRCLFPYSYRLQAAVKASECNLNCINLQWDATD